MKGRVHHKRHKRRRFLQFVQERGGEGRGGGSFELNAERTPR